MSVGIISPDSQRLYGAGLGGAAVIGTGIPTTAVANIPGAAQGGADLAITPDGKYLYIADPVTNTVVVADTATYTIAKVLPVSIAGAIVIVPAH